MKNKAMFSLILSVIQVFLAAILLEALVIQSEEVELMIPIIIGVFATIPLQWGINYVLVSITDWVMKPFMK